MDTDAENQLIGLQLFLDAVHLKYGYDFRGYAEASLKRRIMRNLAFSGYRNLPELHRHVLDDKSCFEKLLLDLSINVTDMFRDPLFYKAIREQVLPELKRCPIIKVWHAGCASGEEVYSAAILFFEAGLQEKTRVYATDFNEKILGAAKEGTYSLEKMKSYASGYHASGGKASFENYYCAAAHDKAAIHASIKQNIVFAHHNLVSDGPVEKMDLIFCRNVLIYFNRDLQNRAFRLFNDSLAAGGYLCLGSGESLRYSPSSDDFADVVPKEKIYRKKSDIDMVRIE